MGQAVYLGLCLVGLLLLNPLAEGCKNDTVEARARCPHGAFYRREYCYLFINKILSWYDAEIECQALKTGPEVYLASILSPAEGKIIVRFLKSKKASDVWIGLQGTYNNEGNEWDWSDGSPFSLPLWDSTYLSPSSQDCLSLSNIQESNTQKSKQRSCFNTLPYLCKFKADY